MHWNHSKITPKHTETLVEMTWGLVHATILDKTGRIGWLQSLQKMPLKYAIFSTVLSKIVYEVIRVFWQEY